MSSHAHAHAGEASAPDLATVAGAVSSKFWITIAVLVTTLGYLTYTWFAFDVPALIERSKPERAGLLATDAVAYKVHVTKLLRRERLDVAIEGERTSTYETPPAWVRQDGNDAVVDLGDGYSVDIAGRTVKFTIPDYGLITIVSGQRGVDVTLPEGKPVPDWIRGDSSKFDARPTLKRRVQVSRAKIEVHRYFWGWENFFFPFRSGLQAYSWGELFTLATSSTAQRLDPEVSNAYYIWNAFWTNPDWQHGNVFVALLETILMAVLGTAVAALVGLPLAFMAASNFTPSSVVRFGVRRLFDFLRGIDMLIWSLIFIRAFGLGPLTGALAIAFTDTGTLGKLFSEALENIDKKQVEGVTATGANRVQRYRFGVIPQILPVFVSQALYYLESNTRSATVIGALGAGGIGLILVETIRTSRDWENTLYIIILTVLVVIAMDMFSSYLRRKLIQTER